VVTEPAAAEVILYRLKRSNRRLEEAERRSLGSTPLFEQTLKPGSYVAELIHPNCEPVRYPFHIRREAHWDGVAPGGTAARPIRLPPKGCLGPEDVWIAEGWFQSGGDPSAGQPLPERRLWCDAFVIRRFPVTNAEYLVYLNDLVDTGRADEALSRAPRERSGTLAEDSPPIYGRGEDGHFCLVPDPDGDLWSPDWPVCLIERPRARHAQPTPRGHCTHTPP